MINEYLMKIASLNIHSLPPLFLKKSATSEGVKGEKVRNPQPLAENNLAYDNLAAVSRQLGKIFVSCFEVREIQDKYESRALVAFSPE